MMYILDKLNFGGIQDMNAFHGFGHCNLMSIAGTHTSATSIDLNDTAIGAANTG